MKYTSHLKQLSVDMFRSSFDDLDKNNRWVKLGDSLPWTELENIYNSRLDNKVKGAGNKPARMIIGACIIKHKFCLSDEETISMIQENPYMQYLCGLSEFTDKPLFDPSLFTTIRKRITIEEINQFTTELLNKELADKEARKAEDQNQRDDNEEPPVAHTEDNGAEFTDSHGRTHKGVLKLDATCADAEVRYPVDADIIHDGCKIADRYIKKICKVLHIKKLRSCYGDARSFYLELVKRKKKGYKLIRSTISAMLSYLNKDLRKLTELFFEYRGSKEILQLHEQRILRATFDMYSQQLEMFEEKKHQCKDRIVSIFQPHVRPIVRGKSKSPTEFGAKIGAAIYEGYTFIDHHSWDAYNESTDLSLQIQLFKERFGYLPATILADKIYMSKANRKILKEYEIKTYCKPLGRPPKEPRSPEYLEKMAKAVGERNEAECSFGTGKRIYRANNIRAKLPETAECWTGMCYFVKNVMKFLRELCLVLFGFLLNLWTDAIAKYRVHCFASMAIY